MTSLSIWSRDLSHIFAAVPRVAYKCFIADAVIMNSMVQLQRKKDKGGESTGRTNRRTQEGGGDPKFVRNAVHS